MVARISPSGNAGLEAGYGTCHIVVMNERRPPELEMTADGQFVLPPAAPISSRILMWAIVIAVLAGALSLAAFALWIALIVLPVAFGAAIVAWAMLRYRMWRAQKASGVQRSTGRA